MGKAARANAKRNGTNGTKPLLGASDHRIQLANPVADHFASFIFGNACHWEAMALRSLRDHNPNVYDDLATLCTTNDLTLIERSKAFFRAQKQAGSRSHVVEQDSAKGQHVVICGAGPSLTPHASEYCPSANQVWGCNSALTYLYDAGHRVTHGFTVDQTPTMLKEWYNTPPTEYLIATTCHPHLTELLIGRKRTVTFFHNYVGIRNREPVVCEDGETLPYEDWLYSVFFPTTVRVGSGLNSVNRAVDLALWMGFARITILGADCSIAFTCPPPKPPKKEMTEAEYYHWINGPTHKAWLANETQMHADGGSAIANDQSNLTMFGEVDGRPWLTKPDLIVSAVWLEKQRQMHPEIEIIGDTLPNALRDKPDSYLRQLPTMVDAAGEPLRWT